MEEPRPAFSGPLGSLRTPACGPPATVFLSTETHLLYEPRPVSSQVVAGLTLGPRVAKSCATTSPSMLKGTFRLVQLGDFPMHLGCPLPTTTRHRIGADYFSIGSMINGVYKDRWKRELFV